MAYFIKLQSIFVPKGANMRRRKIMNKTISKALALALAAAMALTGCTSSGDKPAADNNQGNGTTTDSTATENKGGDNE